MTNWGDFMDSSVVEVVLVDSGNYEKTLRLDNPKESLTLTQIRTAFATPISEGWLVGKNGTYPVTSVARATVVVTTKTSLT